MTVGVIVVQGGDIGEEGWRPMRVVLVWEGVCAAPPVGQDERLLKRMLRRRDPEDWDRVVRRWSIFEKPLQRIIAMDVRDIPVDIVTFLGPEYAEALASRLDAMHVRVASVDWFEDAAALGRMIRLTPDVQYVVDSDPDRLQHYGRRATPVSLGEDWGVFI